MDLDYEEVYAIDIDDVIDYIGSTKTRPWRMGKELAKSKTHFPCFGLSKRTPDSVHFRAVCLTSQLSKPPHKISIVQKIVGGKRVLEGQCSCKANIPKCKHIAGVMLKLEK